MLYLLRFWQQLYVTRHNIPGLPMNLFMVNKLQLQYEAVPHKKEKKKKKRQKPAFHMLRYLGKNAIKCSKEFKIARIKH